LETTVVSYLTAWPSRDVVLAGHQQVTREWWESCRDRFEMLASELVVQEASAGDEKAAENRLAVLDALTLLAASSDAVRLAARLVESRAIPQEAVEDALHLAIATVNGVEYLVTWNCRHLANATMRTRIETAIRAAGYEPPIICTPEELLEIDPDVR
jgi:predicted nucleic acid-binding protein